MSASLADVARTLAQILGETPLEELDDLPTSRPARASASEGPHVEGRAFVWSVR